MGVGPRSGKPPEGLAPEPVPVKLWWRDRGFPEAPRHAPPAPGGPAPPLNEPLMPRSLAPVPVTILLFATVLSACGAPPPPDPAPVALDTAPPVPPTPEVITRVDTVTIRDPELELRITRLELQIAERDAQIAAVQQRLEDANREVVQTMAKLRTGATRAEAASAMAEAEVSVQGLQSAGGNERKDELAQARQYLARSSDEFGRQNFGGALYLATQAKNVALAARAMVDRTQRRPGERVFAVPVPFDVTSRANLRDAPNTSARLLGTLERGAKVVAMGHLGEWLRVSDASGREGWVFQQLLNRSPSR